MWCDDQMTHNSFSAHSAEQFQWASMVTTTSLIVIYIYKYIIYQTFDFDILYIWFCVVDIKLKALSYFFDWLSIPATACTSKFLPLKIFHGENYCTLTSDGCVNFTHFEKLKKGPYILRLLITITSLSINLVSLVFSYSVHAQYGWTYRICSFMSVHWADQSRRAIHMYTEVCTGCRAFRSILWLRFS